MTSYIIRRLLAMIPALLGIALITFILMHLTKGGPFDSEHSPAAVRAAQMRAYHLDEPIWPTLLGSNAGAWQIAVLIIGLALLVAGIGVSVLKTGGYGMIRPV